MGTGLEWTLSSLDSCIFLQDALGGVQDEWLLLPREDVLEADGSQGWQSPVHPHRALGPPASAGVWEPRCVGHGASAGTPTDGLAQLQRPDGAAGHPYAADRKPRLRQGVTLAQCHTAGKEGTGVCSAMTCVTARGSRGLSGRAVLPEDHLMTRSCSSPRDSSGARSGSHWGSEAPCP